jgi:ABC-type histidine transport system ATPase subunit
MCDSNPDAVLLKFAAQGSHQRTTQDAVKYLRSLSGMNLRSLASWAHKTVQETPLYIPVTKPRLTFEYMSFLEIKHILQPRKNMANSHNTKFKQNEASENG